MAHLFTERHRELNKKPSDHELFHGGYAEKMYLTGMILSMEQKELERAIRFKRSSMETLRKHARRDATDNLLYWQEVNDVRKDDRSLDSIRARLKTVVEQRAIVKLNYQIAFMTNRGFSLKEISNVIHWYSYRNKIDCGDPMVAAHIATEKVKTLDQLMLCGMRLDTKAAERIHSENSTVLDIEVEKTSPDSAKFVVTAKD